jgi:hypothetical protein
MKKSFISLLIAAISVIFLSGFVYFAGWSVSPSSYYFPNVAPYDTRDAEFTVYNGGPQYSGGGTVSISADVPAVWSCISGCSYWLEPYEEHTVKIRFTASQCPHPTTCNGGATIHFPTNSGTINGWIGASVSGPF